MILSKCRLVVQMKEALYLDCLRGPGQLEERLVYKIGYMKIHKQRRKEKERKPSYISVS